MKITTLILCLVGAVSASPILHRVTMEPRVSESTATQSSSGSQSSDQSDTSELQSSEENTSEDTSENQTSESESEILESNSDDESSEKGESQIHQDTNTSEIGVTSDNSLDSEENIRKSWVRMFANIIQVLSPKVNSSVKVKSQPDHQNVAEEERLHPSVHATTAMAVNQKGTTVPSKGDFFLMEIISQPFDGQIATSPTEVKNDREGCGPSEAPEAEADPSESSETSEASDSSDTSESTDSDTSESADSDTSESADTQQMKSGHSWGGMDSTAWDSEEYVFQDIGDDAHSPVEHLMMPGEVHELHLRR